MPILIVSNDAGGANIIASYVAHKKIECIFFLKGPAIKIFTERLGKNIHQIDSLDRAIDLCDYIICGSGDQSAVEIEAILEAKKRKKFVVCYLDHWVNYRERFMFEGKLVLPDQIVVSDEVAYRLAKSIFINTKITQEKNYYISDLLEKIKNLDVNPKKVKKIRVLYLAEPIKDYNSNITAVLDKLKFDEYQVLKYALSKLDLIYGENTEIVIRPHPSESAEKYRDLVSILGVNCSVQNNIDLYIEISRSDIIVGYETTAMMIAYLAKKKVFCAIPPGGGLCRLPIDNIQYLRDL